MTLIVDWKNQNNLDTLHRHAGKLSAGQIAKLIPGATRSGVVGKMSRLKLETMPQGVYPRSGRGKREVRRAPGGTGPKIDNPTGAKLIHKGLQQYRVEPTADVAIDLPSFICRAVDLLELQIHDCRWPLDNGKYCGLRQWDANPYGGSSYCAPHHRLGHRPAVEHRKLNPR